MLKGIATKPNKHASTEDTTMPCASGSTFSACSQEGVAFADLLPCSRSSFHLVAAGLCVKRQWTGFKTWKPCFWKQRTTEGGDQGPHISGDPHTSLSLPVQILHSYVRLLCLCWWRRPSSWQISAGVSLQRPHHSRPLLHSPSPGPAVTSM